MYILLSISNLMIAYNGSRVMGMLQLFLELYSVSLILTLFPLRARRILKFILSFAAYIICAIDIYCIGKLRTPINPTLLNTFLQTNSNEASEALYSYIDVHSILLMLIPFILAALHIFTTFRYIKNIDSFAHRHSEAIGLGTALIILLSSCCIKNEIYLFHRLIIGNDEKETFIATGHEPTVRFYTSLHRMLHSLIEIKRERKAILHLQETLTRSHVDSCSFTSPNIVLIIGESYNRHHSELYGYDKNTTPFQAQYKKEGNLFTFSDAVAQWNLTSDVFRTLLSTHVNESNGEWHQYPLFTTLFREAGYDVTFISNQYIQELSDTYSDFNENLLINDVSMSNAQFNRRNTQRHTYDEGIIEEYSAMYKEDNSRGKLTIFHLMGQHVDFSNRYPEEWEKFNASIYDNRKYEERQIISHYDNATLYNDYILHRIVDLFKNDDAIIIFISDHGERTSDDGNGFGRSFSFSKGDVEQQYEIPMWVYITDTYRRQHPEMTQDIANSVNKPICTDNIAHMLLYIGGIHTPCYDSRYNPLAKEFDGSLPRIINGEHNYDTLTKQWHQ